ncbi:MAG: cupredoxin domain-containing protein [Coriobacteriia bacterium]|nr:cupredoxin domain-containing protein [Coriobacteriia bacterium]MBN2847933.1 cupredoxin domain-containing protein [Coriobacteriia bacterium]
MSATTTKYLRATLIALIAVLAFVATYQVAEAADRGTSAAEESAALPGADGSSPACACCGNSGTGDTIEGAAAVEGDVQRITVDATNGYDPNVIRLTAGVPAEITFSQASGCMAEVMSEDLDFYADLTGGPQTVRLEADVLQPGEYSFSCGMQMVFGTIIVE